MPFYKVHALVDIGYHSGEDSRVHVTNQLISFRSLGLNLEFIATSKDEYIRQYIRERTLTKLSCSLMNYGVEGLKRWDPRVLSFKMEEQSIKEASVNPTMLPDLPSVVVESLARLGYLIS